MICEKCKKNPATYHSTVNINGKVTESHLCNRCASENNANKNLYIGNFFGAGMFSPEEIVPKSSNQLCKNCGMEYEQFIKSGKLGCSNCYAQFRSELIPIIKTVQGSVLHTGLHPEENQDNSYEQQLRKLESKLKQALEVEDYEYAIEIKAQMNALKQREGNNG